MPLLVHSIWQQNFSASRQSWHFLAAVMCLMLMQSTCFAYNNNSKKRNMRLYVNMSKCELFQEPCTACSDPSLARFMIADTQNVSLLGSPPLPAPELNWKLEEYCLHQAGHRSWQTGDSSWLMCAMQWCFYAHRSVRQRCRTFYAALL
jgi:hypothetical protein